jgi:hypothetical protein
MGPDARAARGPGRECPRGDPPLLGRHPAGWLEERMARRSVGEALAWARGRAEIVLVETGTRRYWYSARRRNPGPLVPWRAWPPGLHDPETLPGQDPEARLTPLPGPQGRPFVAYR